MGATKVQYLELTAEMITDQVVEDINRLLPQLTSGEASVTSDWLEYLFAAGTRVFVAAHDGRIIGTVLLCPMVILTGQKDWIEDVVVDEAYRRRGIASCLMAMAEPASAQGRAKSINLTSNPNRGHARQMYGDRGYELRDTGVFRKAWRRNL